MLYGVSKYSHDGGITFGDYPTIADLNNLYGLIEYININPLDFQLPAIGRFDEIQYSPLYLDDTFYTSYDISNENQRYIKFISTNVSASTHRVKNNYSSRFGDGLLDSVDVGYLMNDPDYKYS